MAYFKCEGSAIDVGSGALQCSTGWLVVDEPTFTLVTREQASGLIVALLVFFTVMAVWRELANWR